MLFASIPQAEASSFLSCELSGASKRPLDAFAMVKVTDEQPEPSGLREFCGGKDDLVNHQKRDVFVDGDADVVLQWP